LKAAGAALILLLSFACTEPDGGDEKAEAPDELSISTLQSAPDTLIIGEKRLILTAYMWRDFMPVSPPDGKPLIAIFRIVTTDSSDLPPGLHADAAWVLCEGEIWSTWIDEEAPPPEDEDPFQLVRIARDGPKFGPDVLVTAVVRLTDKSGTVYLLRADDQYIHRTD
jgi:hypothetical protein